METASCPASVWVRPAGCTALRGPRGIDAVVRRQRSGAWRGATVAGLLLLVVASGAPAATCDGDCDGDGTVRIDELVRAVTIALGGAEVADCTAVDRNGSGTVSIDELVTAVGSALGGCGSQPDPEALRASSTVAVAPLVTVLDFGSVGTGSTGAAFRAELARPAQISGCTMTDCYLNGTFTGTEQVCCFGTQYTLTDDNCAVDTVDGTSIFRTGAFTLESPTADVCSGDIPVGQSFTAQYSAQLIIVEDPSGGFLSVSQNYTESFEVTQAGCGTSQPDTFGFAVRGDGVRRLAGTRHVLTGDGFSVDTDVESRTDGLTIAVTSLQNGAACDVAAGIGGAIEIIDGLTGSDVVTTYDGLGVGETRDGNDLLLFYQGTVGTDCLGQVSISTMTPVRLRPDETCPLGGAVRLELEAGSLAVTFTSSGGVELDFGADGSVDEHFDRCEQLDVQQCTFHPPTGVCAACSTTEPCSGDLRCYPCSFGCQSSDQMRCSLADDFATCEDGVY